MNVHEEMTKREQTERDDEESAKPNENTRKRWFSSYVDKPFLPLYTGEVLRKDRFFPPANKR
jgi:hypothetical protein